MIDPEDEKLFTLARAARARIHAPQGAALRDLDGRTYAAAEIRHQELQLSALNLAIAMALSSGSVGFEAAVVVSDDDHIVNVDALREVVGTDFVVTVADPDGQVVGVKRT